MNIVEAISDRNLLGASPAFHDITPWRRWLVFLAALFGLPLDAEGEALFRKATGRSVYDPPPGGWREVVAIVGRQAGKTRVGASIVAYGAAMAPPTRDGDRYALLLAQDHRSAMRAAFSYLRSTFEASALLRQMIVADTSDTLTLSNGVRLAAYPCRPASVRGLRAVVAVLDELAYFTSGEGYATDVEMLRAIRPTLATTDGRLVILSSPYGQSGSLWELHKRHYARDDAPVLVWQADAPTMNPTLPLDYLERMREDDPEAYRSEVLGDFRAGLSSLLDVDAIQACVATGRLELAPVDGVTYQAFVDPSGGRVDAFTVAIGHRVAETIVVDVARAWRAPFNPTGVVGECAALLARYRVRSVTGDRYAGEWPREAFRAHATAYAPATKPKSDLYLDLLSTINSGAIEIPDDPMLLRELRGLERRRESAGRDRVDHAPGAHDDRANAVAGLAALLSHVAPAAWLA